MKLPAGFTVSHVYTGGGDVDITCHRCGAVFFGYREQPGGANHCGLAWMKVHVRRHAAEDDAGEQLELF